MVIDWERYLNDTLYRTSVLRLLAKENERKSVAAKNNPEIQTQQTQLDKADKRMTEKRSADERIAENYGNKQWGLLGAGMVGAGLATTAGIYALPWISAAMTPSTYLDAMGAPVWAGTTANGVVSGTGLYFNGKEFIENPSLKNGIFTALSLIPATRADYSQLGNVGKFIQVKTLGRSIKDAANDTKFINVPIEHVSTKGITEGAGLRAASEGDVRFHMSLEGSKVSDNILKATGAPFVRRGTWTYTNNTGPIDAGEDVGNWSSRFNSKFYEGTGEWNYPSLNNTTEDALRASQRGTNYSYTNKFENVGETSFMSTDPSSGIVLSKNTNAPKVKTRPIAPINNKVISEFELYSIPQGNNRYKVGDDLYQVGLSSISKYNPKTQKWELVKIIKNQDDAINFIKNAHQEHISNLSDLDRELYLLQHLNKGTAEYDRLVRQAMNDDLDLVVNSPEYNDRIEKAIRMIYPNVSDTQIGRLRDSIVRRAARVLDRTNIELIDTENVLGQALAGNDTYNLGLNNKISDTDRYSTIWHEFLHNLYNYKGQYDKVGITKANNVYSRLNNQLIGDPSKYLNNINSLSKELIRRLTSPTEVHSRIGEVVRKMILDGVDNPTEAYSKYKNLINDLGLDKFKKEYVVKLLGGLFAASPVIANIND